MCKKCSFPSGLQIKPNGVDVLDPCRYEVAEVHRNVTVEVLRCKVCGHTELSWIRQDDTESEVTGDGRCEMD